MMAPRTCNPTSMRGYILWHGGGRPLHVMPYGLDDGRQHVDGFDCWCEPVPKKWCSRAEKVWVHVAKDGRGAPPECKP